MRTASPSSTSSRAATRSSSRAASSTRCSSSRSPSTAGPDRRGRRRRSRASSTPPASSRPTSTCTASPAPTRASRNSDRVRQFAGEGVDNIIMTDHHSHTDLNPTHRRARLHRLRARDDRRGDHHLGLRALQRLPADDRSDAAPPAARPTGPSRRRPGEDFPSLGAYSLTPAEIDEPGDQRPAQHAGHRRPDQPHRQPLRPAARSTPRWCRRSRSSPPPTSCASASIPTAATSSTTSRRSSCGTAPAAATRRSSSIGASASGSTSEPGPASPPAIADTDTHEFLHLDAAGARTWTASSTDDPAGDRSRRGGALGRAGRAVGGQGVYVQTRLVADDGSGARRRPHARRPTAGARAATARRSRDRRRRRRCGRRSTASRSTPTPTTIVAGTRDGVADAVRRRADAGADRRRRLPLSRATTSPPASPARERWETAFTRAVRRLDRRTPGSSSSCAAPTASRGRCSRSSPATCAARATRRSSDLIDGNLGEGGVLALGFTNALYADVDGEPGFQAPRRPQQ